MIGTFQSSSLRIEVIADEARIRDSLLKSELLQRWMAPQQFSAGLPDLLQPGTIFTTWVGSIAINHQVAAVSNNELRLLLSQGIDGVHQWYWGDGWIQSSLEGVSLLPLNLGHTFNLMGLRQFLTNPAQ